MTTFVNAIYLYDDHLKVVLNYTGRNSSVDFPLVEDALDSGAVDGGPYSVETGPPKCVDEKDAQQKRHTKVWCFCVIKRK